MDTGTVINIARQTVWIISKNSCSCTSCFNDCWFGYKSFSDTYIYSGADFDICAEAYCNSFNINAFGGMDVKSDYRIYGEFVEFLTVYLIKGLRYND